MFIGHYGPAIPLWVLFIAVLWMDIGWAMLVLTGVEKFRIVPGFTEAAPSTSTTCPIPTG